MKEFLKSELQTLKAKTGLNQYETFSNMPDAGRQIGILVDSMVIVCQDFPYIPDTEKQKIIQKMIIQDQEFTALNSRAVWKWLNLHKDSYWAKEKAIEHFDQPAGPLSPETEKLIKDFQDGLARQMEAEKRNRITAGKRLMEEMDKITIEDAERLEGKKTAQFQTGEIEAERKALHLQYLKENYDPITGKKLPGWIEESDWIANQL